MNLICAVCGAEHKATGKFCSECGSQKFIEQDQEKLLLVRGDIIASRYKILDFLKAGGMGAVYKAEDLRLSKLCAIKELINQSLEGEEKKAAFIRFEREAKILSELEHPNLPRVIDYFTLGNRHYLAMDYIDGEDLSGLLKRRGSKGLDEEEVVQWALQICDVLNYLHTRNPVVIYRDIKPSNIMLRRSDNKAMLIDFGIARTVALREEEGLTKTAIGTIGYMAPEQYRGKADVRSDIYSLGATMHHLLSGKMPLPFTLEPLKNIRPDISSHVNAVVMTALRLNLNERFQSALEMKKAIAGTIQVELPVTEEIGKVDLLLNQLDSKDPELRYIVIKSLFSHRDERKMLQPLMSLVLKEPDLIVRREALKLLGSMNNKMILEIFNHSVTEKDPEIRETSIQVLKRFKDKSSADSLIKALTHKDTGMEAAMCLMEMKEKRALEALFLVLKKETSPERQEQLEHVINTIDSDYLAGWREEKLKEESGRTKKKEIKIYLFLIIFIIILSAAGKIYIDSSRRAQVKKLVSEGEHYLEQFDYNSATDSLSKAVNMDPGSVEALYLLGRTCIVSDRTKAELYLNKALEIDKDYPEALMEKGKIYLLEGNLKEAVKYLQKAVKQKKDLHMATVYLAEAYYKAGNKTEAEELFNRSFKDEYAETLARRWLRKIKGEKIEPSMKQKVDILLEKGRNSIDNLDFNGAVNAYQEVISINPDDWRGYAGMAYAHLLRRNTDMSLKYFNTAIECDPQCTDAFYNIASIYMGKDDYKQAVKYVNIAMDFAPSEPNIHYMAGLVYYKEEKKEEALREFKIYITLAPYGEHEGEIKGIIEKIEKEKN
ncbi:MAG: protein kinase [Candidatus Eremiobacterota bacterium]